MTCPPHVFRPKSFPLHGGSELFCENCGMTETERDAALAASPPVDQGRIERLVRELAEKLYHHTVTKYDPAAAERCIQQTVAALTNKGANP